MRARSTAITPTTQKETTIHVCLGLEVSRKPLSRASWKPAARVIVTTVGMIKSIFGMNRVENSIRAGIDIRPMIGPTTKPTKRSIAVHSPPPTTWQNIRPQRASRADCHDHADQHERHDPAARERARS